MYLFHPAALYCQTSGDNELTVCRNDVSLVNCRYKQNDK